MVVREAVRMLGQGVRKAAAKLDPTKCRECAAALSWRDLRYATDHRCRGCQRRRDRDRLRGTYVAVSQGLNRAQRRRLARSVAQAR